MNFEKAIQYTIKEEGWFSDHPDDRGGATKFGISIGFMRQINPNVTTEDIAGLSLEEAKDLYKAHFWDRIRGDDLPMAMALLTFDMAVTSGQRDAVRTLQAAVGTYEDGIIGPVTIRTANESPIQTQVVQDFSTRRVLHFSKLPGWAVFGRGWVARTFRMHDRALRMVRNG